MLNYQNLYDTLNDDDRLQNWLSHLPQTVNRALDPSQNSNIIKWRSALEKLPDVNITSVDLKDSVTIDGNFTDTEFLRELLSQFHPWRKGPFSLFQTHIDTEWRSDWKWDRIKNAISLKQKTILDVGCGNGYHCWRMAGSGANLVVGIDPLPLYIMQYQIFAKYLPQVPAYVLPLKIEDVPMDLRAFDSVFSMGVLYHRRSPIDHLYHLKSCLKHHGQLILETLVIDGENGQTLLPEKRYAKMRNVWFIPSCLTLEAWLKRCGFIDIELVDVSTTSLHEQRATKWMTFESLRDFLDPQDTSKTIEGYPAPKRAIFIATKK
ncbi:tRNA 5-methoxyuridine(34)/uridine 5-oxyacetic acid(34) synthase CmoB [Candidatus Uabimicrobium amorphum]|uniref:tRNA U34 carboxymethyltransferase n=1 Tax=Uabimicrobium amorphum TaxID=2596890 RepID=A0A5S9F6P6_UABAM|nr:tRNA 5-methoxyuridine(34)/uridine 5-oxyacetic acid(34) synthase CmoB [Candidatus Uabimicrobium amorphum]BBM88117.1 tRNA U34 carboxymethyltransferase [Candidatus Uabimicrobium amorphum]